MAWVGQRADAKTAPRQRQAVTLTNHLGPLATDRVGKQAATLFFFLFNSNVATLSAETL